MAMRSLRAINRPRNLALLLRRGWTTTTVPSDRVFSKDSLGGFNNAARRIPSSEAPATDANHHCARTSHTYLTYPASPVSLTIATIAYTEGTDLSGSSAASNDPAAVFSK